MSAKVYVCVWGDPINSVEAMEILAFYNENSETRLSDQSITGSNQLCVWDVYG